MTIHQTDNEETVLSEGFAKQLYRYATNTYPYSSNNEPGFLTIWRSFYGEDFNQMKATDQLFTPVFVKHLQQMFNTEEIEMISTLFRYYSNGLTHYGYERRSYRTAYVEDYLFVLRDVLIGQLSWKLQKKTVGVVF
ncbi:MAG: hypothetical protein ACRC5C_00900 [Bacilli bacterium]